MLYSILSFAVLVVGAMGDNSCVAPGVCTPPNDYKYTAGRDVVPRVQWPDSGGFCGSSSIQAIAQSYGAWISQDLIRKAAPEGGGHGNPIQGYEILHTNIESALSTLHFKYESWDWENAPQPQGSDYLAWMKQQLVNDNGIVQFVICKGDGHNSYGTKDDPIVYDHIEPFWRIYSNHSLDDLTVYDEDIVQHGSDYAPDGEANAGYFRNFSSLLDDTDMEGNCLNAQPGYGKNEMYPCIYETITYGYSMMGLDSEEVAAGKTLPLSLFVNCTDEPDVRQREAPALLQGHITVAKLTAGVSYSVFRWDDYTTFPTTGSFAASKYSYIYSFEATSNLHDFYDDNLFWSDQSVVYACVATESK
jgi:hypothetical protein